MQVYKSFSKASFSRIECIQRRLLVLPFAPDAWIDRKKSKVGYEIPFTQYFYKYEAPRPSSEIMAEIRELEAELAGSLDEVFS